jgi:spore germination cell wall hydrolase CwlJ-like protein
MIGLSKIGSTLLLLMLSFSAVAETNDVVKQDAIVTPEVVTQESMTPPTPVAPSTLTDIQTTEPAVEAPEVVPQTATVTPEQELLEKAKRENAARASMRKANLSPTECLALAMYHEARGEGQIGMLAVAFVIHNRMISGKYPTDFCQVILQKSQFSFTSDSRPDNITDWKSYEKILALAVDLVQNGGFQRLTSPVGAALYFNSFNFTGRWAYARAKQLVVTIGRHHFFK